MMQTTETESSPRAADLETSLRRQGYRPGFPATISLASRQTDLSAARRMRCPVCNVRFRGALPFHKPNGGYRLIAVCTCGVGEEV